VGFLYFLQFATGSSFIYLSLSLSSVSLPRAAAALASHVRHPRRLSAVLNRATCPSLNCCRLPRPRAGFFPPCHAACRLPEPPCTAAPRRCDPISTTSCSLQIPRAALRPAAAVVFPQLPSSACATPTPPLPELRRAATRTASVPAPALAQTHLLLDSERILELLTHLLLRSHTPISLVPSAPITPPRPTSAAPPGHHRQPPTPPPNSDPVLLEHHRDSLQLIDPPNFVFLHPSVVPRSAGELQFAARSASPLTALTAAPHHQSRAQTASSSFASAPQPIQTRPHAPEQPDRSADELLVPLPLGFAVDSLIPHLLAPAEHPVSTTSPRRSFSTTSPPPSSTLATEMPATPSKLHGPPLFAAITLL
jgi:hypothetical protein